MYDLLMFRDDFPPTLLIFSKQNLPKCQIQPTLTRFHKSLLAKTTNKEQITGNSVGLLQQMEIYPDVWQWLRAKSSHQPHPCWSIRRSILSIFRVQKLANILKSIPWKKTVFPTWGVFSAPPGYSCASKGADWLRSPSWMKGHK
jgi:hypothetical protein